MASSSTGYFLVSREAFRLLKAQGIGGAIVFIGSKNGLAASPGAAAYCTAKAAEIHLARCLALEGAPLGIRVNVVNPDAVLRGSRIWQGEWREQRAAAYKIDEDELEEHVPPALAAQAHGAPEDIAEARLFLRLRRLGEVDRQHPQRRCRQRRSLHALVSERHERDATIDPSPHRAADGRRPRRSRRDYDALGEQLARRGIDIDAIKAKVAAFARRGARPGASAPAAPASRASPGRASRATSSTSSRTAPSSSS